MPLTPWTTRAPLPVTAAPAVQPAPAPAPKVAAAGDAGKGGAALPKTGKTDKAATLGHGWAGTSAFAGRVFGVESNPDLAEPRRWCQVAREMVRTDGTLATCWEVTKSTLLAAQFVAEPGDENDPRAVEMADSFNLMMGWGGYPRSGLRKPFEHYLSQMLRFILTGFRYGEVGWSIAPDGRWIVSDAWLDRDPTVHDAWLPDPETGELAAVMQTMPTGDASSVHRSAPIIPADALVLLVRDQEGADYNGVGMLRACYIHWKAKRDLLRLSMRAAELWSCPVPMTVIDFEGALAAALEAGRDESGVRGEVGAQADAVRGSLDDFLRGDSGRFDTTKYVGVDQFGGGNDPSKLLALIDYHETAMLTAFLLQMLRLGVDNPARSVSETHAQVKRRSVINIIQQCVETWAGHVIPKWVAFNYGDIAPELCPVIRVSGLEADVVLEVLDKLSTLAERGLLGSWGKGDIATLRRRLTLDPEVEPDPTAAVVDPLAGGQA